MSLTRPRKVPPGTVGKPILVFLLLLSSLAVTATASASFAIVSTSGTTMYTDLGNGLDATYLSFKITSSAAASGPFWAQLDTHGGNIANVGTGQHQLKFDMGGNGAAPVADTDFTAGHLTKGVFFLVSAGATSTTGQTLTVNLFSSCSDTSAPGCANGTLSGLLATQDFSFTVADTIQANANKVTTVVTIPANPSLGQLGSITVTGCTGTVGAAKVEYFTPVSSSDWPADSFEFVDSDINIATYPNNNYKDITLIPPGDVDTADHCYTEIFTFEINDFGSATTTPANFISSGTQIKHTTNTPGTFDVVIPHGDMSVTKVQSSPAPANNPVLGGTNVTYRITATNNGPADATTVSVGDSFTVGSATFVSATPVAPNTNGLDCSGFTALPGSCTVATLANGQSVAFDLVVTVPNDGTTTITDEAHVTSDTDNNSANDTADVITPICPDIDLSITKEAQCLPPAGAPTSPKGTVVVCPSLITSIPGGQDFQYHIVVTNNSTTLAATNVVVTDTLPVGLTYVSDDASCDTSLLPKITCSTASLAALGTFPINVRVTADNSGTIDNTATVGADQCDSNSGNNSAQSEITVSTVNQPVALEADREDCGTDSDCVATVSDKNRVFEPNETARVDPSWKNTLDNADSDVKGTASLLTGPGDGSTATYTIVDSTADYGPIPAGATSDCQTATGDCYNFMITQTGLTRPHNADHPRHWDASFHEALNTGETFDWELHIGDSFTDVPRSNIFYRSVETIFHNHITVGCQGGNIYCPGDPTTRQEMSAFIARSIKLKDSNIPSVTADYDCVNPGTPVAGQFVDVPATNLFCKHANYLRTVKVTLGCFDATHYCPLTDVTRGIMATFIARAYVYKASLATVPSTDPDGDVPQWKQSTDLSREYNCTGSDQIDPDTLNNIPANTKPMSDVDTSRVDCKHIGFLFTTHILGDTSKFIIDGSNGTSTGVFLPDNLVRRDETSKFLANAFGDLPLYGPLTF